MSIHSPGKHDSGASHDGDPVGEAELPPAPPLPDWAQPGVDRFRHEQNVAKILMGEQTLRAGDVGYFKGSG